MRSGDSGVRWGLPIHVELPGVDGVVLHDLFQLRAAGGHHNVGCSGGRQSSAIDIGVIEEVDIVDDDALFGGWLAGEHSGAVGDAGVFLYDVVAGTGGNVVAVGPDGGARIVGEERALELVAVIRSERIGTGAYGVTNGVGTLGLAGRTLKDG